MISIIIYLGIGIVLSSIWFKKDYEPEYKELQQKGELEKGMAEILMMGMAIFWPFKLVKKLIKEKKAW